MASALPLSTSKPRVRIVLWGDSHLCSNHFFPQEFQTILAGPTSRFDPSNVINNSVGGKRFDDNFISQFHTFLSGQDDSFFHVHVIFLAGNNIRAAIRVPGTPEARKIRVSQTIDYLVQGHTDLLAAVAQKPKSKAILVAPLPSLHVGHEIFFESLSSRLHVLATQNNAGFADVRFSLARMEGLTENGLTNRIAIKDFFQDDVHLNRSGANILAKRIFSVLTSFPNSTFGYYKPRSNRKAKTNTSS